MWEAVLQMLFWLCVCGLTHTYLFYPAFMCYLARRKQGAFTVFAPHATDLPHVTVILSAYNEQVVLPEKLANLQQINYPTHLLSFQIGSDGSTDRTQQLLSEFALHQSNAHVHLFEQRRGKPPVVNELAELSFSANGKTSNHLLLFTDASVMLQPDTVYQLARHFINPKIGCVDAHMLTGNQSTGINASESVYMQRETRLKQCESRAWGTMIGPFGGCYMLRSELFRPVPPKSLVDDFYLGFGALEAGYRAINDLEAICFERPTTHLSEEYRRKRRIAAGSMKNLGIYKRHLLPPFSKLGFAFLSHKVLRWFGPGLLAICWACSAALALKYTFWASLFLAANAAVALICLGYLLNKILKTEIKIVQSLFYFLAMNVALLHGIFDHLKGIRTDIWQPTRRE